MGCEENVLNTKKMRGFKILQPEYFKGLSFKIFIHYYVSMQIFP